jgi:hypothetical protein
MFFVELSCNIRATAELHSCDGELPDTGTGVIAVGSDDHQHRLKIKLSTTDLVPHLKAAIEMLGNVMWWFTGPPMNTKTPASWCRQPRITRLVA